MNARKIENIELFLISELKNLANRMQTSFSENEIKTRFKCKRNEIDEAFSNLKSKGLFFVKVHDYQNDDSLFLLDNENSFNKAVNKYVSDNNRKKVEYRQLLDSRRSEEFLIRVVLSYIEICSSESEVFYITDPYFFYCENKEVNHHTDVLLRLLDNISSLSIHIFTSKRHYKSAILNKVLKHFEEKQKNIQVFFTDSIHDRFWVTDRGKGFILGASINGIANKLSHISYLDFWDAIWLQHYLSGIEKAEMIKKGGGI